MNANEIRHASLSIARVIAASMIEEWHSIDANGRGDPKGQGNAKVNVAITIATTGAGNHSVILTVPGRSQKFQYTVTPSDLELPVTDSDNQPDPGEPEP
jgi:hypothetical protein